MIDFLDSVIKWERGELDAAGTLRLFSVMVQDGTAWTFQGVYGRTAANLIEMGFLTTEGDITPKGQEIIDANDN